jgi:hypothetical protein
MSDFSAVLTQALDLSSAERANLAHRLLESLDGLQDDAALDDTELEDLVAERQQMLQRGECEVHDWRDAMAQVERDLNQAEKP